MKIKFEVLLKGRLNTGNKISIRKWSKDWQLPSEYKIDKYEINLKAHGKEIKAERFRLLGRMGNKNTNAKKWYKGASTRGLEYVLNEGYVWCILKSKFSPNISISASDFSTDGKWLYLKVPEDKVGVWYSDPLGRINFYILPREINLTEEFWEVFGILQGEMTQKSIDLKISNTEPLIVNLILNFFDENNLTPKDDWNFSVSINSKDIPQEERDRLTAKIKDYWSKKLNIPPEKITHISWYDQFSSYLNPNYGEINLQFGSSCLKKVVDILLEFVKENAQKNKKYAIPFLRGLFGGEGSVEADREGRLLEIELSAKKLEDRQLYKRICEAAGLKATCEFKHHHVRIHNIINFLKCLEYDIFKLHESRRKKFIMYLRNFVTIRALHYILQSPKTVRELVKLLNLSDHRNLNKNLSKLTKEGILYRRRVKRCYIYYATPKLLSLLRLIDQ